MSSIVRGGRGEKSVMFGKLVFGAAALVLMTAATGCTNSSTTHDMHAQNASGSSVTASADANGADSEARSDWRTGGAGQAAADRSTRQAERSDTPNGGPDPLPWQPSTRGSAPSNGSAGTTNQRNLRLTPPSNNQR